MGSRALGAQTQQQRGMALEFEQRGHDPLRDDGSTWVVLENEALRMQGRFQSTEVHIHTESKVAAGDALRGISETSRTNGPGPVSTASWHS